MNSDRRHSLRVARLRNALPFLKWTSHYCTGGCGYPVSGRFYVEIDKIDGVPVRMLVCEFGGSCERVVNSDPRDETGASYADIRPALVAYAREEQPKPDDFTLSFGA